MHLHSLLFPSSHWHVKGFSAKCIALKANNYVIEQENILFAGTSEHLSARKFITGWGSEGVNVYNCSGGGGLAC